MSRSKMKYDEAVGYLPGGIGSNKASHALILSKNPLRVFSVCNKKLSSLKQRQEKC